MKNVKEIKFDMLLCLVALFFIAGSIWMAPPVRQSPSQFFSPPPFLEHFHFGERMAIADTMWVRVIQDFDYCDSQIGEKICRNNSWLFKMIDAITELDPQFVLPHTAGAVSLSVLVGDVAGAAQIFQKGTERFPKSWKMLMQAAYHAIYEEKDNEKGARLMEKAARAGAPPWTYSLAAKLYTESGKKEFGIRIYEDLKEQNLAPEILERIKKRLEL